MKINCLFDAASIEELTVKINQYFNTEVRVIRSELSLYEQYEVRPKKRIFIEEIWKYRIVAQQGKYFFGKI
jgi:hypothetical protein